MTRRLLVAALTVLAAAVGCGSDTEPIDAGAVPQPVETNAPVPDPGDGPRVDTTVYFLQDGELVPVARVVADRDDLDLAAADAVRSLLTGPTVAELEGGLATEIPRSTRLLDLRIGDDRIATVDLSQEFQTGGDTAGMQARLGQVACTLDNVVASDIADGTRFRIEGRPVEVISGRGAVADAPVSCADYAAVAQGSPSGV